MQYDPIIPYNDLPLLPPKADIETKAVLKKCICANRALAELKGVGELIPNQSILINSIPLQEAKLSSEIENIITTNDKLYKAATHTENQADPQTKEVLRYRQALNHGWRLIEKKPLSTNVMIEVCSTLLNQEITVRKLPGTCISNPITQQVIYTPPVSENVIRDKLRNLEDFIHNDSDLDPIVKLALIHYQFEAIHPFHDGNGRTGRIVNLLYLIEKKLLSIPVLYLSRYIMEHKKEYYALLRGVTEQQNWEDWIIYILTAVETTANITTEKVKRICDMLEQTIQHAKQYLPSRVYSKELIELIFVHPYCKINFLVEANIAKRQTASGYLQALEKIGILEPYKVGKEIIYVNPNLIKLLSE